jgi:uncharacterized RDD family membrane protein YckC
MAQTNPFLVPFPVALPVLPLRSAPFGKRAAALALDHLMLLISIVPGFICVMVFGNLAYHEPLTPETTSADVFVECCVAALPIFAGGLASGFLLQCGLLAMQSRSLGKRWMGLRIVRSDGRPAGAFRILGLRTFIQMLHYLPLVGTILFIVNVVLMLLPNREVIHDQLADTRVIVG